MNRKQFSTTSKYNMLREKFDELPYNPSPQEIYDVLNNVFGMCGFGWKYRLVEHFERKVAGKAMVFARIDLYINCFHWSDAIPSIGGIVANDKSTDIVNRAVDNAIHGALRRLFLPDRLDKKTILRNIAGNARRVNFTADEIKKIIHEKYNVDSSDSLTVEQAVELNDHFYDLLLDVLKREHNLLMTGKK